MKGGQSDKEGDRPPTAIPKSFRIKIHRCLLDKVQQRGYEKTICPSEVARAVGEESWRDLMEAVRDIGTALADEGQIEVLQKGKIVDPRSVKGPIRYRLRRPN